MSAIGRVAHRVKVWLGFAVFWISSRIHRVRFTRSEHLPRRGAALIVVNHQAPSETTAVARMVIGHRRFPHFLAKASLFAVPGLGWLGRAMKQIPVHRGTQAAADALAVASGLLAKGQVVVMYPEGTITRQPDQRPGPAKTGAARLALSHPQVPVIPVGQWGARPGTANLFRLSRVTLLIGSPVDLSRWRQIPGAADDPVAVREATAAIMAAITALVEQARGKPFSAPDDRT